MGNAVTERVLREFAAFFFLLFTGLILLGRVFFDRSWATFQDNTYLILPIFSHISAAFSNGEYPYWMNTVMGGIPLYNNPQFSPAYPFYFFHSGLYSTPLEALQQVHYVTIFHLFILHINSYILLRVLRLPIIASILAATFFAFSPNMTSYAHWVSVIAPYSWFPLLIAAVLLVFEQKHARAGISLGIFSVSMLTLAAASQPLIHAVYFVLILYIFHSFRVIRAGEWARLGKVTLNLGIMSALGVIVSSPSLIPALLDFKDMIRWVGNFPPVIGNERISFEAFLVGQSEIKDLANAVFRTRSKFLIGNSFIGPIALFFAFLSVFEAKRRPIVLLLFFTAIYGLLSSTGGHLGLAHINYHMPFLNKIREPQRHLFLFVFSSSVLAGFGFAYFIEAAEKGFKCVLSRKHVIAAVLFAVFVSLVAFQARKEAVMPQKALWASGVFSLGLFLAVPAVKGWKQQLLLAAITGLAIYINMVQYPVTAPSLKDGDYFNPENLASHRVLEEISEIKDIGDYRIIFEDGINKQTWAMNASYHGLRSFNAYFNPLPYEQFSQMYYQGYRDANYHRLLGAKYMLCTSCDNQTVRDYRLYKAISDYKLYVNDRALPRYYPADHVAGAYKSADDFFGKISNSPGPGKGVRGVYVNEEDLGWISPWLGANKPGPECVMKKGEQSLNRLTVSADCDKRALFVLNEYFTENWKARVNGRTAKTFKVNLNQVGVLLDKGVNLVEMEYSPILFIRLLRLQKITVLLIALYLLLSYIPFERLFRASGFKSS